MSMRMIADNLLEVSDFLRATEQASPFWQLPEPDPANAGAFKPTVSGTPEDSTFNSTTTGDGNVGGTTVICSLLGIFGDDFFIGATLEITSGTYNGQSRTVSDFAQTTGTLTVSSAFGGQIVSGVTFTLTIPYASRDIRIELIAGGDAGEATFKWSHDGGTTYLGRFDPNQSTWLGDEVVRTGAVADFHIGEAQNGDWIVIYRDQATSDCYRIKSSDFGLTWSSAVIVDLYTNITSNILTLSSGKILIGMIGAQIFESTDNGDTWTKIYESTGLGPIWALLELPNGNIAAFCSPSNDITCLISTDGARTFGSSIDTGYNESALYYRDCVATLCHDGSVLLAYRDGSGNILIIKSIDNCVTWSFLSAAFSAGTYTYQTPELITDISGDIYCFSKEYVAAGDDRIVLKKSADNGSTWGTQYIARQASGKDCLYPRAAILGGHIIGILYRPSPDTTINLVRAGIWETYSANACPTAAATRTQKLTCEANLKWYGGAGIIGDKWTIEAAYDFAMENIIEDSPSKPWRSEQDNIACEIVLDLGAIDRLWGDGIAFFGCNLRSFNFQMNASDSWGSPSIDETISFDLVTGAIDSLSGYAIQDTSLLAGYKDHELKGLYLRLTSGTDSGLTYKIEDNIGSYIILELTGAPAYAASDTFAIYQSHISKTFTGGYYRFARISISAQETSEGYYQIGAMICGRAVTLTWAYATGYDKNISYDINLLRTARGGLIAIKGAERKRIFRVSWPFGDNVRREVVSMLDYVEGKNIALIPNDSSPDDCYLVKLISDVGQKHRILNHFDVSIDFEEVL